MITSTNKVARYASAILTVGLLVGSLIFSSQIVKIFAAETISVDMQSFSGVTEDATNVAPGLNVIRYGTAGYYVQLNNESSTTILISPTISLQYPTISDLDFTAAVCEYVIDAPGLPNSSVDFLTPTSCIDTFISGSTYEYTIGTTLPANQTIYFRISNLKVVGFVGAAFDAEVSAAGTFLAGPSVTAGPVESFITPVTPVDLLVESFSPYETDTTHISPGLRVLPGDAIGYYADVTNLTSSDNLSGAKVRLTYPVGIVSGSWSCRYIVASAGTVRSTLDFNSGTVCTENFISGTTYDYSGPALLAGTQTLFFRWTNVQTSVLSSGSNAGTFVASGVIVGDQGVSSDGPISSYVTTSTATISGFIFYDNGSGNPTNSNDGVSNSGDHLAVGVGVSATDGSFTSATAFSDSLGNFSFQVPINDLASAPLSSAYTLNLSLPVGYHFTTSPTSFSNLRVATSQNNSGHIFGINNQTDLALSPITVTPAAVSHSAYSTVVFHYTVVNQSLVTATDVDINITAPVGGTISGSPVASTGTYSSGVWNLPLLAGGVSATLDVTVVLGAAGGEAGEAEIMSMTTPIVPTTTPVSTTADIDSVPGGTSFISEDDYQYLSFTVTGEPTIQGVVFQDNDNDGNYEGGEPGLSGRTVTLYNEDIDAGVVMGTTTTNGGGTYTFNHTNTVGAVVIENSTNYRVEVAPVASFTLSSGNMPQQLTTEVSGPTIADPIGYFSPATITGRAFNDSDHDGLFNNSVDNNLAGITVQLLNTSDSILATTTTAPTTGIYSFTGLIPRTYRVRFVPPTGSIATLPNVGSSESIDSDISSLNTTVDIPLAFAQILPEVDAGFFNDASISGNIFQDFNYNSLNDSEAGMNDVTVTLHEVDLGTDVDSLTLSDNTGDYVFNTLIPGNYQIRLTLPTGYGLGTYRIGGTNQANDSDFYPETGYSDPILLTSGQDVTLVNAAAINNIADLRLSKSVNQSSVDIENEVTFTIGIENQGPATANGVVLRDLLPAGLTYVSSTGDGAYDPLTGNWTIGTLLNDEVAVRQIVVEVTDSGVHTNTVSVLASDNPDFVTSDNTASAEVIGVSPTPSVDIRKSVSIAGGSESSDTGGGPQVFPGQAITYYIDVANTSQANVTDFVLEEHFPTGLDIGWTCAYAIGVDSISDHSGDYNLGCTIEDGLVVSTNEVKPGEFLHVRLTGRVTPSSFGVNCNEAEIILDDVTAPESDIACFTTVSPNADLALTKTVDPNQATIGEQVVYTLHLVNNGPNTSTGAVVTDALPSGLQFVSSAGDGVYSATSGHWNVPNLANGSGATLNITAEVTAAGVITNVATITTNLQPDDDTSDNEDSVPITGIAPPTTLVVQKFVQIGDGSESTDDTAGPAVARNQAITYFVDVQNTTTIGVSNVAVSDVFPTGISPTGWQCHYDIASNAINNHTGSYSTSCTVQSDGHIVLPTVLATNAVMHIRLTGQNTPTSAGTYCNQALTLAQGITTPVSDTACFHIVAQVPASLQITHGSNVSTVTPGGQVTYTITVTNNGGTAANNVVISDNLGNELNNLVPSCVLSLNQVIINNNGTVNTNNPTTIDWAIGTLQPGESRTVSIIATIRSDLASSANCQTTAVATADEVPNAQAEANITVPVVVGQALITLNKEAINPDTVFEPGDNVQYRITVTNSGDGASTALQLKDALPGNMAEWKNVQSTLGTVSGGAGLTVDNLTLAANTSAIVTYTGQLKDSDAFSLRSWKLDKSAEKEDADFYPDQVVRARLTSTDTDDQAALGAMDQSYVNLGQGGSIILATSSKGKVLVDGDDDDFCLALGQNDASSRYRVSVAKVNQSGSYERLRSDSQNCYDISSADLPWIRYIKIEDQSTTATGINLDAVCLLHVGGLIRNTANLEQSNAVLASDMQDIAVDFTDVFEDPISASACAKPKQAQVLAPAPLPPPPVVIPTPIPLALPKTGSETPIALAIMSSMLVAGLWLIRKQRVS